MIPSSASKQGHAAAGRPVDEIPKAMNNPQCSRREFIRTSALVAAAVAASAKTRALPPGAAAPALAADDSLAVVKAYADTMIDRGRDVYGPVHSPLFATTLDRTTHRIFAAEPPAIADIRSQDRPWQGGNPMHDQNLYQILYALSELTGETRYATEADRTLRWFLGNCQSAETGLLAWGEHCHWGFVAEQALAPIHEFHRPSVLWGRCCVSGRSSTAGPSGRNSSTRMWACDPPRRAVTGSIPIPDAPHRPRQEDDANRSHRADVGNPPLRASEPRAAPGFSSPVIRLHSRKKPPHATTEG